MVRKSYIFILLLVLGIGVASAQSNKGNRQSSTVTGKVVSVTDDEPLIGAIVAVKGTNKSVTTDLEGNFSIVAPQGSTLVVSYAGYDKAEVTVTDKPKIIRLIPAKPISGWIYISENPNPRDELQESTDSVTSPDASPLKRK